MSLTQIILKTIYPVSVSIDENGTTLLIILIQLIGFSLINEIITPTKTEIKLDFSDMIEIFPIKLQLFTIMLNPTLKILKILSI